jgi:hypothetical protein
MHASKFHKKRVRLKPDSNEIISVTSVCSAISSLKVSELSQMAHVERKESWGILQKKGGATLTVGGKTFHDFSLVEQKKI